MQEIIVALIVLAALLFAVWRFIPARWRRPLAARLGLRPGAASASGCSGCQGCGRGSACGPKQQADATGQRQGNRI